MSLILSHKIAKDFIFSLTLTSFTPSDLETLLFSTTPLLGTLHPQTPPLPSVLLYGNTLLHHLYDYIIDHILEHNLHFDHRAELRSDRDAFKLNGSTHGGSWGVDARTYYLFKYVYGKDRRYAMEPLERYDNFEEYLPLVGDF